ncbi:MAG: hypothetical protein J6P03_02480, partial [Opitutales bacterium]|nr:hypothetical protein [Opitutales bacterium]
MKKSIKILVAAALVSSPLFADCVMADEGGVSRLVDFSEGWIFSKAKLSADGANIESVDYPLDWTATQVEPFKGSLYKVNFALDKWSDDSSRLTFHSGDCHYTLLRDGVIIDSRNNKVGHLSDWSRSGLELVYHYDEAAYKGSIELISGNDRVGL